MKALITPNTLNQPWFEQIKERIGPALGQISTVFWFSIVVYIARFSVTILVARTWGPSYYGKVALVMSIGSLLYFLFAMGLPNAMYRQLPRSPERRHNQLIWTTLVANSINALCLASLLVAIYSWVAAPISIPKESWYLGILLALANNYGAITEAFLRGKKLFHKIGVFKVVGTVATVGLTLFLLEQNLDHYPFLIYSFMLGLFVSALVTVRHLKVEATGFSSRIAKAFYSYGFFLAFGQLLTALIFEGDIILLNHFLSHEELGKYAAYMGLVKQLFFVFFIEIFCVVFLPSIANADRAKAVSVIKRFRVVIFFGVALLAAMALVVVISLFGSQYELNWLNVLITAMGIGFFTLFQLFNNLLAMDSKRGANRALICIAISLVGFLLIVPPLASNQGLTGAITGVALSYFVLYVVLECYTNIYFGSKPKGITQ